MSFPKPSFNHYLNDPQHVRNMVYGLVFECPMGGNPCDCFAHELRALPMQERVDRVNAMNDAECLEFYQRHLGCLEKRSG